VKFAEEVQEGMSHVHVLGDVRWSLKFRDDGGVVELDRLWMGNVPCAAVASCWAV
jgi:hypothetical protein